MIDYEIWFVQEDERRKEERDERKRKYNVKWNDEVFSFITLVVQLSQLRLCRISVTGLFACGYNQLILSISDYSRRHGSLQDEESPP